MSQTKQDGQAATRYYYDQQGNLIGDNRQRRLTYTPFNKVERITRNTTTHIIDFAYGPDRARFLRIDTSNTNLGTSTTTTVYLGNVEHVIAGDKSSTYKRYLAGGSVLIIQDYDKHHTRTGEDTRYLLKDHLGSIARILDKHGTLDQSFSFDAWGERRSPNTASILASLTLTSPIHTATTTRGYTGHEMLDAVGIIHMNGRIYDPKLGRFLQADPVVQFPDYTQSWNSYSYVLNNPLVYTDPTGYFIGKLFKKLFRGLNKAFGDFAPFVSIALLAIPGMPGWVMQSWGHAFGFGFVTGGIATGSLKGALFGGISAAAFYGIGEHFAAVTGLAEGGFGHILTHGLAGGILAELQGGQFGHGFLAAGLSKAVMGRFSYEDGSAQAVIGRTTIAAIVGGTVSRITGGKFANGAMTSAMAQLFNAETHARNSVTKISEAGLKHIMESEGYSATVYPDQAGHPTIGYGHKLTAAEMESGIYDNGITQVQAKKLLQQDLSAAVNAVGKNVTVPLAQNQFDALVSLTYNIGVGNFRSSTLLTQLNSGNYAGSANQFLSWNKITVGGVKTVSRGLTNRRLAEKCMFHGGC